MKANRKPDGSLDLDGSADEIATVLAALGSSGGSARAAHGPVPPVVQHVAPLAIPVGGPRHAGVPVPGSLRSLVAEFIRNHPGDDFTARQVTQALGRADDARASVSGTLHRLATEDGSGVVRSDERGHYRAAAGGNE